MSSKHDRSLQQDDDRSRPFRAARLAILDKEFGDERYIVFSGAPISAIAFEEARLAYLAGLFLATIVLVQISLEHTLGGMLRQAGRDGSWTFGEVLRLARADRLISEAEYEFMERLRSVRNPYVHTRPPLSDGTLMSRVTDDLGEADLLEEDATEAVIFLLRLTGRYPFSGTEGKT